MLTFKEWSSRRGDRGGAVGKARLSFYTCQYYLNFLLSKSMNFIFNINRSFSVVAWVIFLLFCILLYIKPNYKLHIIKKLKK